MVSLLKGFKSIFVALFILDSQFYKTLDHESDGLALLTSNHDLSSWLKVLVFEEILHLIEKFFRHRVFLKVFNLLKKVEFELFPGILVLVPSLLHFHENVRKTLTEVKECLRGQAGEGAIV